MVLKLNIILTEKFQESVTLFRYNFSSRHHDCIRNGFEKKASWTAFPSSAEFINHKTKGERIIDMKAEYEYERREDILDLLKHHFGENVDVSCLLISFSVFKKH